MNSIAYTRKLSTMIERIPSKLDSSVNYFINDGLEARFVQRVQIVPRVGADIATSCGIFLNL